MIYGCGPIGQMAIQLALAYGVKNVIAIDIDDLRTEQARQLGAIAVNSMKQDIGEVVKQVCGERGGVDVILEISGAASIYDTMADYLRKEGKIMLLAHPGERVSFDIMKTMHHSGATIKGIFGRRIWDSWDALTELVASGKVDLTKVITHRFPLSAGNKAFEQIAAGSGKVLFMPEWEA
ncbi:MAG: zinc-binding dehydrogenase [Oscillospiraceae bacterium]|nr:zinc-binding dehydrogenase [Oscillospiraceae bacterium]